MVVQLSYYHGGSVGHRKGSSSPLFGWGNDVQTTFVWMCWSSGSTPDSVVRTWMWLASNLVNLCFVNSHLGFPKISNDQAYVRLMNSVDRDF